MFICLICFNLFFKICFFFLLFHLSQVFLQCLKNKKICILIIFFLMQNMQEVGESAPEILLCVLDEKLMLDGDFYSAFFFSISGVPAN